MHAPRARDLDAARESRDTRRAMGSLESFAHAFETPLGPALAVVDADGAGLALEIRPRDGLEAREERLGYRLVRGARAAALGADLAREVAEYFAGRRRRFDVALRPRGTAFQRAVWERLARIPFGETTTYGAIARELGRPDAARAVGAANGRNPLWLVLPCHRVVGADGRLVGYAGGLDVKRALLRHEGLRVEGDRVASDEPTLF